MKLEEEEQMRRAEATMKNSLIKHRDFRKILKNFLKKNRSNSHTAEEYEEDENGEKKVKKAAASKKEAAQSFDDKLAEGRSKFQDPDFKLLPPFAVKKPYDS